MVDGNIILLTDVNLNQYHHDSVNDNKKKLINDIIVHCRDMFGIKPLVSQPKDIDIDKQTINFYVYNHIVNLWEITDIAFKGKYVVFDLISEPDDYIKSVRHWLDSLDNITMFNQPILSEFCTDKLKTFHQLKEKLLGLKNVEVINTYPNSYLNRVNLMDKHKVLVFKPRYGSKGKGVMYLRKYGNKPNYEVLEYIKSGNRKTIKFDYRERRLYIDKIKEELGTEKKKYIIQEFIDTDFKYLGNNYSSREIRTIYTKSTNDKSNILSFFKIDRLAGDTRSYDINTFGGDYKKEIIKKFNPLTLKVVDIISKYIGIDINELAIDYFYVNGKIYLLEVNSKYGKRNLHNNGMSSQYYKLIRTNLMRAIELLSSDDKKQPHTPILE